ncbi:MAG: hypothetical protein FWH27_18810 [Planctomycetaceae bacterium]|nr:hypothetical protein [Planctomycetaceae bacterium]
MKKLITHPQLENLLPPLSDAEYKGLEEDILKHGCLTAIVIWGNIIVDGHARHALCEKHGLPFDTVELEFDSLDDAILWTWKHQEHRRNMTPYQRAVLALQFKLMIAAKAKNNMSLRGRGQLDELTPTNTRNELAKMAGVSEGTLGKAEYLDKHADEETKQRLRKGETSIHKEYTRIRSEQTGEETSLILPLPDPQPVPEIFQEAVTLPRILLHDTSALVNCLFSFFDLKYRKQLILDVLEKMNSDDGCKIVGQVISVINQRFPRR